MLKYISLLFKVVAYVFLFVNCYRQSMDIAIHSSYLYTGKLMGVESMLNMVWACFISFLISSIIYGFGIIVEYYGKRESK